MAHRPEPLRFFWSALPMQDSASHCLTPLLIYSLCVSVASHFQGMFQRRAHIPSLDSSLAFRAASRLDEDASSPRRLRSLAFLCKEGLVLRGPCPAVFYSVSQEAFLPSWSLYSRVQVRCSEKVGPPWNEMSRSLPSGQLPQQVSAHSRLW